MANNLSSLEGISDGSWWVPLNPELKRATDELTALKAEVADLRSEREQLQEYEREIADLKQDRAWSDYVLHELCDYRLCSHCKVIFLYLRFRQGDKSTTEPGKDTIAYHAGIGVKTVERCLTVLESTGHVRRIRRGHDTNLYVVSRPWRVYGDRPNNLTGQTNYGADPTLLCSLDKEFTAKRKDVHSPKDRAEYIAEYKRRRALVSSGR